MEFFPLQVEKLTAVVLLKYVPSLSIVPFDRHLSLTQAVNFGAAYGTKVTVALLLAVLPLESVTVTVQVRDPLCVMVSIRGRLGVQSIYKIWPMI